MFPSVGALDQHIPLELLTEREVSRYGIYDYWEGTQYWLMDYSYNHRSDAERKHKDEALIWQTCIHHPNFRETYVMPREELRTDQEKLEYDREKAKTIWMKHSDMLIHKEKQELGFDLPPIWNQLVTLVREEYSRCAKVIYSKIQMNARTMGDGEELRLDMLRHVTCLLKFYGFTISGNSITFGDSKKYFEYMLKNPTYEDLENEVRADLISAGKKEEELPPRYPETPTVPPSPLEKDMDFVERILAQGESLESETVPFF